jgi:hypothetical protein
LPRTDSGDGRYVVKDGRLYLRPPAAAARPQTPPPPPSASPRDLAAADKPSFFDRMARLWPQRGAAESPQPASPPAGDTTRDSADKKSLLDRLPKLRAPKWMAFGRSDTDGNR